ncbi:cupin domain-containing protein [Kallotenue papyrolyticum]|uniref:cupin domain-containing protein n=1 Tax=Kallotenue papyrolyticum TaxID=1325125 RepID=UPI000471B4B4|nr:cupin domain-containing protein [Kallotenue papyrolyticum]
MYQLGRGIITTAQDVDALTFPWGTVRILSEPTVTGAQHFSFGVVELAPGQGHARHNHPGAEEIIYVLEGEGEQMIDDRPAVRVRAGDCIFIPADSYHATLNVASVPLRLAIVYAPAGPERVLRELPDCRVMPAGPHPPQGTVVAEP